MKNTLFEDLSLPLDKVQRNWLRRIGLVCVTPFAIIVGAIYGMCKLTRDIYKDCWYYKDESC